MTKVKLVLVSLIFLISLSVSVSTVNAQSKKEIVAAQSSTIDSLYIVISNLNSEILTNETDIDDLKTQLMDSKNVTIEKMGEISKLTSNIVSLNSQLEINTKEIADLNRKLESAGGVLECTATGVLSSVEFDEGSCYSFETNDWSTMRFFESYTADNIYLTKEDVGKTFTITYTVKISYTDYYNEVVPGGRFVDFLVKCEQTNEITNN